jgi:hypothetical protein
MILADYAQVAEGKLYIAGGGWTFLRPAPTPTAIALLFHVPWDRANTKVKFSLKLMTQDGQPVTQEGPVGSVPVAMQAEFEIGRPPGIKPGSELNVPFAMNVQPLLLAPGQRFYWDLTMDGHTEEDWRLPFATRDA